MYYVIQHVERMQGFELVSGWDVLRQYDDDEQAYDTLGEFRSMDNGCYNVVDETALHKLDNVRFI